MAETAPAAPPAEPATAAAATKKKQKREAGDAKAKKPTGPCVSELALKAVAACTKRKGLFLAGLKKSLSAQGYYLDMYNSRLKLDF